LPRNAPDSYRDVPERKPKNKLIAFKEKRAFALFKQKLFFMILKVKYFQPPKFPAFFPHP
jgi:hypothetical protein